MAINAKDRFARLPKARQEKILARAQEMIAEEMSLAQLREACLRSQRNWPKSWGSNKRRSRTRAAHRHVPEHSPGSNCVDGRDATDYR